MKATNINTAKLSQKYRTNVPSLIRAWKKGSSDMEISFRTGINLATLSQIKYDLEMAHLRARLAQKQELPEAEQFSNKHHILLNPFL
ncbi:hypothetical protein SPSYN_00598 [Sporotomaculum syntrophicum]|uniref:Uncharacterized protein n=1 Tax=Sporotomaculum syntrophicum TaxID=182264 RepID=A0A9D2WR18_9FIRM|nr:hypothetical protein [Sporotomaculum syntrophicum]KAF1085869.1 hypothetical protein SPSYN_00598 [Sporotomaculum syntrophicum]